MLIYNNYAALLTSSQFSKHSVQAKTLNDIGKKNLEVNSWEIIEQNYLKNSEYKENR